MSGGPGPQRAARGARLSVEAWEALFRAQVAVMRRLERDDIWDEVTMREYDVLVQVAGSPDGRPRLRDLNERILLSQPSLSRLVERLESRGLVTRERADDDARGVVVGLTEQGAEVQRRVGRRHVRTIQRCVGGALSEAELRVLHDLCHRLRAAQDEPADAALSGAPHPTTRQEQP
jgi:DNA-binding MarR family transcriptional regulator